MNCKNCNLPFDLEKRIPKLLPNCGHSICLCCVESTKQHTLKNFKCPLDNIAYENDFSFNDNLFIIEQIQKKLKQQSNKCDVHNKKLELYCNNCTQKICVNCVLFGIHKLHQYHQIQENENFDAIVDETKKILKKKNEKFQKKLNEIQNEQFKKIKNYTQLLKVQLSNLEKQYNEIIFQAKNKFQNNFKNKYNDLQSRIDQSKDCNDDIQILHQQIKSFNFCQEEDNFQYQIQNDIHVQFKNDLYQLVSQYQSKLNCKQKDEEDSVVSKEENLLDQTLKNMSPNDSLIINVSQVKLNPDLIHTSENMSEFSFSNNKSISSKITGQSQLSNQSNLTNKKSFQSSNSYSRKSFYSNQSNSKYIDDKENFSDNSKSRSKFSNIKIDLKSKLSKLIDQVIIEKKNQLDLTRCGLNDDLIKKLSKKFAQLKSVKTLKLNYNRISDTGIKYLLKSIKHLNIEFIFVTHNHLEDIALDYFISFRKYNKKLRAIYMTNNLMKVQNSKINTKINILKSHKISLVL